VSVMADHELLLGRAAVSARWSQPLNISQEAWTGRTVLENTELALTTIAKEPRRLPRHLFSQRALLRNTWAAHEMN
jgi:hypothetical protein